MKELFFYIFFFPLLSHISCVNGNLRCYSCAPCDEFDYFAIDKSRYETDCLLDRHCLKISGTTRDIYGVERTVSVRGCPFSVLFPKLQEGCTSSTFAVAGIGEVIGDFCLCGDHLCNAGNSMPALNLIKVVSFIIFFHCLLIL